MNNQPNNQPTKITKKRCPVCKKKIKLVEKIIGKCVCENFYCSSHRFPKDHDCPVDHQKKFRDQLAKENTRIKSDKVIRI